MDRYTLCYDMTDIYDSMYVQKQVPALSRMSEVLMLVNDKDMETQSALAKITGNTQTDYEWNSCIYFKDRDYVAGHMFLSGIADHRFLISGVSIENNVRRDDIFLAMLSRAIRNIELGSGMGEQLYIEFTDSDMYYICMEHLGEGTEFK